MRSPNVLGNILMIEDNPADVRLTKELFAEEGMTPTFHVVTDTSGALDFLNNNGEYSDSPAPDVIFLDWHLPSSSGGDILGEIGSQDEFDDIPLIVQTGSGAELEVIREQEPRADGFVTKPVTPENLREIVADD